MAIDAFSPSPELASVATILLAGGKGSRLHELTAKEAKPAVHFAGSSRIVDFSISNAVHSGLPRLLVATQYAPASLKRHIPLKWGPHFGTDALALKDGLGTYEGTADAVRRNWQSVTDWESDEILVLAADHVYEMDYGAMIRAHRASGADVTVAVDVVPRAEASGFGVMHADASGTITSFYEKPANPPGIIGEPHLSMASMGIYVFSRSWLESILVAHPSATDFGHHLIPIAVEQGVAQAYRLPPALGKAKSYWRDVGTLDALRVAQLEFADTEPCRLPEPQNGFKWRYGRDSILMPGATVSRWVRLSRTIVAPQTHIPPGLVIGEDPLEDRRWFRRTTAGTVLVTQAMLERRASDRARSHAAPRLQSQFPAPQRFRPSLDNQNA